MGKFCNDCKNYRHGEYLIYGENSPHHCAIGNDDKFKSWWLENGHKTTEPLTEMDCYERTPSAVYFDDTMELLKQLEELIDKKHDTRTI